MGYGGNLIWTAVFRTINEVDNKPVRVAHKPLLSDLLAGRLYNRAVGLADDPVFRGNPRLEFTRATRKGALARARSTSASPRSPDHSLSSGRTSWPSSRCRSVTRGDGPTASSTSTC